MPPRWKRSGRNRDTVRRACHSLWKRISVPGRCDRCPMPESIVAPTINSSTLCSAWRQSNRRKLPFPRRTSIAWQHTNYASHTHMSIRYRIILSHIEYAMKATAWLSVSLTLSSAQSGCMCNAEPFTKSVMLPDASRIAEPPANTTNNAYDVIEISSDKRVPFGMDLPGSRKSPEIFAPAWMPVTNKQTNNKIISRL